jgi:hypothetical protein
VKDAGNVMCIAMAAAAALARYETLVHRAPTGGQAGIRAVHT